VPITVDIVSFETYANNILNIEEDVLKEFIDIFFFLEEEAFF